MVRGGLNDYLPDVIRRGFLLLVSVVANGELMTTLSPTTGEELTTILGGHFAAETVLVQTTALGGLKRSFHRSLFFGRAAEPAGRFVKERKGKPLSNTIQTARANIYPSIYCCKLQEVYKN